MMIKWVVCSVPVSERGSFAKRQRAWKQMQNVAGFQGRIGGWNIKNPIEASTLTFWRDMKSYEAFSSQEQAPSMVDSQEVRHTLIDTQAYEKQIDIFGLAKAPVYSSISDGGHLLKIGDCQVNTKSIDHFLLMQQSVWNLGMSNTPGMTTGLFAKSVQAANRFLILTRWKNESEYHAYENHILPKLLHWAYDGQVEEQFQGRLIRLMNDWCVLGKKA